MPIARAREAAEAAQICFERKLPHSATSRAYYAMFWAAQAALAGVGVRRTEWSHTALLASFASDLIRRRKVYPAVLGQHFNRAMQLRLDADYRLAGVSLNQAAKVVRWAEQFVTAISEQVSHGADDPETH